MDLTSGGAIDKLLALHTLRNLGIDVADSPEALQQELRSAFLPHVDALELHRRVSEFRKLNFREMSYQEVSEAIRRVIMFETPLGTHSVLQVNGGNYPAGTKFYRVRRIPKGDHITPLRSMSKVSDCWEPPGECIRIGRLNKEREPILYTSPLDPSVAIGELRIPEGEWFSLILYEAVKDISVATIGGQPDITGLNNDDALKIEMIQGFLRDEFTRDVGRGTEYLYRISEIIAKDYFDLPPAMQDAWCYPSIVDKTKFNVAFRPNMRTKLRLIGVEIAKVNRMDDRGLLLSVGMVATKGDGSNDLAYYHIGSPKQREVFPWIAQKKPAPSRDGNGATP
ncbi:MAG: hypothetical protein OXG65_10400 [Chloroflexi bacterium]|nr:hypothetical protein [Chloroflexota bacterium]